MKKLSLLLILLSASPALAAGGPFFSLHNTNFVVLIAFLVFIGVVCYFKVPALLGGLLDKRAAGIQSDLTEARKLREEAQLLLASYERKHKEVQEQADRIVEGAKREAVAAGKQARIDLDASIARRVQAAVEQIASAEARAVKDVRDRAISVAVAAAGDVMAQGMTSDRANKLIDGAITEVGVKLH
ncbi:F0F1 ATP synthase subunit B [Pseudoruegeria sp. SK021]|uniref:F0F1 ATP synthase subunit B n=1 Tax=Pseudoruegeria sp. SK021 TaxID=1933035 RepID=UPI000A23622E|nr:F0F1 ATP synthase subunit B [Pseudoruegeria sp. SK021]OSP56582.1 ATP F0F1 synthase subunit B [Pseudoruegeria sp. SK021]